MASVQDLYVALDVKFIYSDQLSSCNPRDADAASFWITQSDDGTGVLLAQPCEYTIYISQKILNEYAVGDLSHETVIEALRSAVC